jgi:hypothetical protein
MIPKNEPNSPRAAIGAPLVYAPGGGSFDVDVDVGSSDVVDVGAMFGAVPGGGGALVCWKGRILNIVGLRAAEQPAS